MWLSINLKGQVFFTRAFTEKLYNAGLELKLKEDHWFKVSLPDLNHVVQFDLCLEAIEDSAELRFIVRDSKVADRMFFPEPYLISMVANLATNDRGYWISSKSITGKELTDVYKAEWAAEMSFVPKSSVTNKKYGKAFALYRQDYGMIYTVLFYNYEYPLFNNHLRSINFLAPLNH